MKRWETHAYVKQYQKLIFSTYQRKYAEQKWRLCLDVFGLYCVRTSNELHLNCLNQFPCVTDRFDICAYQMQLSEKFDSTAANKIFWSGLRSFYYL